MNDNDLNGDFIAASPLSAHGHAALLLVESLIHGLVDRSLISVVEAIEIVEVATEVSQDSMASVGAIPHTQCAEMLTAISDSLRVDA